MRMSVTFLDKSTHVWKLKNLKRDYPLNCRLSQPRNECQMTLPPPQPPNTHTPRQRASSDAYTLQPQCVLKNTPGLGLSTVFFETLFSTSFSFITTVCFLAVVGVYNKLLSESRFVPAGKGLGMITSVGSPQVLFGSNSDVHSCSVALQLTKD